MYTMKLVESICERLSAGEPLAAICREDGIPAYRTVKDWMDGKPDVSAAIARAREAGEDALAAECLTIADDGRNDWIEARANEGDAKADTARTNGEVIQRSKLRIETRLKLLAKWNPKKWGDKVQLADADGNKLPDPPQFIVMPALPVLRAED
jgi:hypothetical protein